MNITLPKINGELESYAIVNESCIYLPRSDFRFNRTVYAAAHVVADPLKESKPWNETVPVDWERTMAFRESLWKMGFGVADAMDTAKRGMGLSWQHSAELIRRSAEHARSFDFSPLCCGVGTDQLDPAGRLSGEAVMDAYREQFGVVEDAGATPVMMASRALRKVAKSKDDYQDIYSRLLGESREKVILHWLGESFDPALRGYWGSEDIHSAMKVVLDIIKDNKDKIEGIKISLLDDKWERKLRNELPAEVKLFTGDDFNYSEMIEGDTEGYSHGLLGIFDPIAPVAGAALTELTDGNVIEYRRILEPTVALSREIFRYPTQYYKSGVVLMAWLNGYQDHFSMLGGMQSARSLPHYAEVFRLADKAGALIDPELACERMRFLAKVLGGI